MTIVLRIFLVLTLAAAAGHSLAGQNEIEKILALAKAPPGVVFEVVSGKDALTWAIPEVKRQSERLRARFPGLSIALVSHGSEQFALTKANRERYAAVHNGVREIRQSGIDVQVCGTHASWRNLDREDFPDYVDVVAAGPVTISNYREIGYHLVVLRQPAAP